MTQQVKDPGLSLQWLGSLVQIPTQETKKKKEHEKKKKKKKRNKKRCSTSLVIKGMQIKIPMRHTAHLLKWLKVLNLQYKVLTCKQSN